MSAPGLESSLLAAITHGRPPRGGLAAAVAEVGRAFPSASAAARSLGIARSTWSRLAAGKTKRPAAHTADAVRAAQRRLRVPAGREKRIRASRDVRIRAVVIVSKDETTRFIALARFLPADIGARLLDAYHRGDRLAPVLADAVTDKFYRQALQGRDAAEAKIQVTGAAVAPTPLRRRAGAPIVAGGDARYYG